MSDGEVLLRGEALPGVLQDGGAEGAGDVKGAVGGAGVDDDDLVCPADGIEGAGEILFFVAGDDGYGKQGHGLGRELRRA